MCYGSHAKNLENVSAMLYNSFMTQIPANWRRMSESDKDAFLLSVVIDIINTNEGENNDK